MMHERRMPALATALPLVMPTPLQIIKSSIDNIYELCRKTTALILAQVFRHLTAFALIISSSAAFAGDFVFGLGQDNLDSSDQSEAAAFQIEYHSDPIRSYAWGSVSAMGVLEFDEDDDLFAGGGLSVLWEFAQRWFVEGSLAAGYYDAGSDGLDLGGDIQFRTLLGIGYRVTDRSRLSLAIDHLSNAGLEDENPGRNALFLRYAYTF